MKGFGVRLLARLHGVSKAKLLKRNPAYRSLIGTLKGTLIDPFKGKLGDFPP